MIIATPPKDESERLKSLQNYKILDSLPEEDYDAIAKIASSICNTPIALISLIDKDRQWFKANHGLDARETPRDFAFCAHSILEPDELFIINDATKDDRFFDNPLTTGDPNVIFYAGAPLNTEDGYPLGTLCVIDNEPKTLNEEQKEALKLLANQVVNLLELRKKNRELENVNKEVSNLNEQLNNFAYRLTHDLKSPINGVNFLVEVLKTDHAALFIDEEAKNYLNLIADRMGYMSNLVDDILHYTKVNNENIVYSKFNIQETIESIITNIDHENLVSCSYNLVNTSIISSKIGLMQVFQNLISNSIKFTDKENVELSIELTKDNEYYTFVYCDNGPGIPKAYRDKVFNMFETLSNEKNNNTGIGLTTVKSIIERLGGTYSLEDPADNAEGICFQFKVLIKDITA
ncbi:ATP-binding protein [Polaribacter sp. MED152]|uniref:sensor histidine kinase n=1 Tax=Polaribacter sp. MED152 TaxID=313598 RepID=UPI000068CA87|nr:GAF domain-containing sensor histidine kinase [Polaribacter sp. MED152]EAQ41541.1 two-component system sensor histidine kinase [Polaribacter sp. MED152]